MRDKKYILVLSGGGAKGAFQAGALKYIFEKGFYHGDEHIKGDDVKFDYIAGVSAGSLNAVMVAMDQLEKGAQTKQLEELWLEMAGNPEKIWTSEFVEDTGKGIQPKKGLFQKILPKINFWKGLGLIFSKKKKKQLERKVIDNIMGIKAFASNEPLRQRLKEVVDIDRINEKALLRVGFVSLDSGNYESVKHTDFNSDNEAFVQAIMASTSMPIIWNPIQSINVAGKQHTNLVDGGIRNVSPLGDIIDDINADYNDHTDYHVIIINNHEGMVSPLQEEKLNFLNIAKRSLVDISLNEIFVNDIREFMRVNRLVHQVEEAKKRNRIPQEFDLRSRNTGQIFRKFYYKEIKPEISIGTTLDFSEEQILNRLDHGYQMAKNAFGRFDEIVNIHPDPNPTDPNKTLWAANARSIPASSTEIVEDAIKIAPKWDV